MLRKQVIQTRMIGKNMHVLKQEFQWRKTDQSSAMAKLVRHTHLAETVQEMFDVESRLILGLRPANERRHYKVTPSLIGWAQT